MFERLEQKDPDHFAVRQYKKFLLSAGKTRSSILISCGARLAPFDIREVRELMEDDEMELDTIGDEKTVLFLIMSDTDTTFNFILAMLQSQLINLLCDRTDDKYGGRLPVHVRLILDEFANIGQIPKFDKLIASIRSREISASIILQTIVIGLGGGLCVWSGVNLLEGYGQDSPGAKNQGVKQLVAGGGVTLIGVTLIPLLSGLLG